MLRDGGRAPAYALGVSEAAARLLLPGPGPGTEEARGQEGRRGRRADRPRARRRRRVRPPLAALGQAAPPRAPPGARVLVTAVEQSPALAACAAAVMEANGVSPRRVRVVQGDVRRLRVEAGAGAEGAGAAAAPSGLFAPRLPRPADLAVFEVFDAGLIGEGALHIAAALVRNGLVAKREKKRRRGARRGEEEGDGGGDGEGDRRERNSSCDSDGDDDFSSSSASSSSAVLVPCRATVFCQLISTSMPAEEGEGRGNRNPLEGLFSSSCSSSGSGSASGDDHGGEKLSFSSSSTSSSSDSSSWPLPWARGAHSDYEAIDLYSPHSQGAAADEAHPAGAGRP